ncbi:tripartite tricarboxylate transporter TctB family protein [Salicibibacter cibi]|uniref:Tripartite tricarboxylate transporter TctB family protein n=1 Tax=Salicibibacter cibi TaxID=2743001 RepID=A0A7T7CE98_9BACI|nr:tripartite tricarboxylate transporter TctB family protein [Salicibibacter cibi]QQK78829.1 tripartite tricarboxylate transporter TctB family protein [Salicibibacter cibi]
MKRVDLISSIIVMAVAIFFLYQTFGFPATGTDSETGPEFIPRIFSTLLMILGIILFIKSFITKEEAPTTKVKMIALTIGILFVYLLLINFLGYYSSTILFVLVLLLITNIRKIAFLITVPIMVALFIFVFFENLLTVPIPTGILF